MDGIHDLGGMHGFGPVQVEHGEPVFHEPWEARAFALNLLGLRVLKAYNVDEYRHAVERMDPAHYLAAPYYERWFTGVSTLLVEKGIVTCEELEKRAGGRFPLSLPAAPVDPSGVSPPERARFAVSDVVIVRRTHPRGHTRVPRYVRGKRGTVLRVAPRAVYPDQAGHGLRTHREHTYHVEFPSHDLWSEAGSRESVIVDLWESYLENVS